MKLKYYIPTSGDHIVIQVAHYILVIGAIILVLLGIVIHANAVEVIDQSTNTGNYININNTNGVSQSFLTPISPHNNTIDAFRFLGGCGTVSGCYGVVLIYNGSSTYINQTIYIPYSTETLYTINFTAPAYLLPSTVNYVGISSLGGSGEGIHWNYSTADPLLNGRGISTNNELLVTDDMTFTLWFNETNPPYPFNTATIYKYYPPLTGDVNFSWYMNEGYNSHILIAKDPFFNLLSKDVITANRYSTQSLDAGVYYWKVRSYNMSSGGYGLFSAIYRFTLVNNVTATGAGIDGIVYELSGTTQVPLSGAIVYIYNLTWSNTLVVGSNGYYIFSGLEPGTVYYLKSTLKDYSDSTIETVTASSNLVTHNILMKKTETPFFENDKQYVKFKVRWLYCASNCLIPGVTVTVYKVGESVAYTPGLVTDSTGSVNFLLYKTQPYRITAVSTVLGISQEMSITPKDNDYIIMISNANPPFTVYPVEERVGIKINVTKNQINNVSATITVNYTDHLSATTGYIVYLNRTNMSNLSVPIVVASWSGGSGNQSTTFTLTNYSSDYLVHVVATHGVYGKVDRTYSVTFTRYSVGVSGISSQLWLWFAIGWMFFTAAVFPKSIVETGFIIVCGEGWVFLASGLFAALDTMPNMSQFSFGIGLTLATVLAFFAYFKKSQSDAGYTS